MVTAALSVVVVMSTNLFNCIFCIGICGVGSGAYSSYSGSSLAHHFKNLPRHHHRTHSMHLTMVLLVTVSLVTLVGL